MNFRNTARLTLLLALAVALLSCAGTPPAETGDADIGPWTDENYPPYIKRITHFGQRADWSHDGTRIIFLERTYGDVFEINLETGVVRGLTHHFYHNGFTRALYLSNGDILLSGSRTYDPENHELARFQSAELWVLGKDLSGPPVALGERCSEGPAVSRTSLKIAWAQDYRNYPDKLDKGVHQIHMAGIDYSSGEPKIVNKKLVMDTRTMDFHARLEAQNFVPPDEKLLTFSAYDYQGGETMTVDLETGEIVNHTNTPEFYEEPEGIFPDGKHTLVETDRHNGKGWTQIDTYVLALDGSGEMERITFFNTEGLYKGSNPVVSDDGRFIAFQVPPSNTLAGVGAGLYILDVEAAGIR